jgi:FG-GAP repeat
VFTRTVGIWSQQAYLKASNTDLIDGFGGTVALSADGNTLAVGANGESSNATGINGDQTNNGAFSSGAVYVFVRSASTWSQQAYVKASNTDTGDRFGFSIALSADGSTLAVGAEAEGSNTSGINGTQTNNAAPSSGAVYIFTRATTTWSQQAYIKAGNTVTGDRFGWSVALSADGNTLAVGALMGGGNATGVNGGQINNNGIPQTGAVYVFARSRAAWTQQAFIKASNADAGDQFGWSVALSADGNTLAVGAIEEDSESTGINGDQAKNGARESGAVYTFTRDTDVWVQKAYVKSSNTNTNDRFGKSIALSADGTVLAVGTDLEASRATGIGGNQTDNSALNAGAVYLY